MGVQWLSLAPRRHRSRAGALPRLHFDHAGTRPKCSSTGGVPVAPSEMMSHSWLPDSPAPCRYSSKGSGAAVAVASASAARGGVCTRAAKVSGSRISVKGELVEEAKHRGADRDAASAIWGLEDRIDLLQTCSSGSRDRATNLPRARDRGCKPPDSKPRCLHGRHPCDLRFAYLRSCRASTRVALTLKGIVSELQVGLE